MSAQKACDFIADKDDDDKDDHDLSPQLEEVFPPRLELETVLRQDWKVCPLAEGHRFQTVSR